MGEIRLLDDQLANRIAAGEVVERPASVVKELVENALDAGADRIHIEITEGGIRSIRVSDNGQGMDREDVLLAFERHATSKIRRARDLFSIRSLGFRGEALPSIASVSKLTLTTARAEGIGTRLVLEGGKLLSTEDAARSTGTEVTVEELFFNTPARLKYLKTVNTEVSHVADHVGRQALAHPTVSFVLIHNGKELFRTPGDGKLLHVAHVLYGKQVARKMLPVDGEDMDFKVEGLAAKPEVTRSNRSYISIVVNGRYIRNIPVSQAVLRGYDTLLPIGRYPIVVLSLSMDPKLVDVNVHPAKLEVRFSKEKELCRLIEGALKACFREHVLIPQAASPRQEHRSISSPVQQRLQWDASSPRGKREGSWKVRETGPLLPSNPRPSVPSRPDPPRPVSNDAPLVEEKKIEPMEGAEERRSDDELPDLTPLTQIHGTYIIAQSEDGFYLMDQHAAHERIYYERFYSRMQEKDGRLQPLLMPLTVECTPAEAEMIRHWAPHLSKLGMEMEPFGNTAFLVRSHPVWFPKGSEEELLWEVLDWVKRGERVDPARLQDDGAKLMACKAAIKANRHLRREEMESLIQQLRACVTPYTCPHGRPILIHFSTYEIEKMFKRVM